MGWPFPPAGRLQPGNCKAALWIGYWALQKREKRGPSFSVPVYVCVWRLRTFARFWSQMAKSGFLSSTGFRGSYNLVLARAAGNRLNQQLTNCRPTQKLRHGRGFRLTPVWTRHQAEAFERVRWHTNHVTCLRPTAAVSWAAPLSTGPSTLFWHQRLRSLTSVAFDERARKLIQFFGSILIHRSYTAALLQKAPIKSSDQFFIYITDRLCFNFSFIFEAKARYNYIFSFHLQTFIIFPLYLFTTC